MNPGLLKPYNKTVSALTMNRWKWCVIEMNNKLINLFWKRMQNWNLITQKQPQLKRTLPKFLLQCYFRLTVLQVLNKNVHGKLSNLRMQIKVGRFWNLHSSFSVPEWSTCYFSLLLWVNYEAGRVLKINIIMMSGEALSWSTVKFSKLVVKKIRSG